MKVGIDLLHIKPGHSGGVESYIRNLLKGFGEIGSNDIEFLLFVSNDNEQSFRSFTIKYPSIYRIIKCNINSFQVAKRILWENIYLDRLAYALGIDIMFVPVYSKPILKTKLPYIVTIHDLQAFHFPQYFSLIKRHWLYFAWKRCVKTATKIVAISEFVRNDIIETFESVDEDKVITIYNPIDTLEKPIDFSRLEEKYHIKPKKYFYTISSLLPHKNTEVLLRLISKLKKEPLKGIPDLLVVSGVGVNKISGLREYADKLRIRENIVFTGFISDSERNALYKDAFAFLFPSLFEGFGMPPVEAMMCGIPVITTKCAAIPEVTQNMAIYVEDPMNEDEWYKALSKVNCFNNGNVKNIFSIYSLETISHQYIKLFRETHNS